MVANAFCWLSSICTCNNETRVNHDGFFLVEIRGGEHRLRGCVSLSEGYGHGVCLGDGQTEVEGVLSQGGRGDTLLGRILSYVT